MKTHKFQWIVLALVSLSFVACKERETQVEYWDDAKNKRKYVFEVDKETGLKDGFYKEYWKNGNMRLEGSYKDGQKHGTFKQYLSNGQLWFENNYKEGLRNGEIKAYNLEGKLISKGEFKDDRYVHTQFFTDPRNGKKYPVAVIGSQVWMAASLDYETPNSACYKENPDYCDEYGRLYTWKEALTVCPDGWHLPTVEELKKLVNFVGGTAVGGLMLKATSTWHVSSDEMVNGEDAFGFAAYDGMGYQIQFWSSTDYEYNDSYRKWAYHLHLGTGQDASINAWHKEGKNLFGKEFFSYVRCIKNGKASQTEFANAEIDASEFADELNATREAYLKKLTAYVKKENGIDNMELIGFSLPKSDLFDYKEIDKGLAKVGFIATNKKPFGNCKTGNSWSLKCIDNMDFSSKKRISCKTESTCNEFEW